MNVAKKWGGKEVAPSVLNKGVHKAKRNRGQKRKIWWQQHLEKKAEKKAKWGKSGWKDQDEEEEDEKDEAPPGVDADHEPLGKKDGHDCDHDDGSGEAPGLSPAIMVN